MLIRIILLLVAIVSVTACNSQRSTNVTDPNDKIDIRGASVLPPQEKGWKIVQKTANQLHLAKRIAQSDTSYVATVMITKLPDIESKEQFSNVIHEKFLSIYDTGRFTILKQDGNISYSKEYYCWRYHIISEDRAAKTKAGKKAMTLEIVGNICQHPKNKRLGVHSGYSQRYYPGNQDPEIKNKADEFLVNVTFTDFTSKPAGSEVENDAKPFYDRALSHLKKSQYDEAIRELNKAIDIFPRYALAYNDRGVAYLRKQQYDRAISDFTKALDINPKHHYAHHNRGIAHLRKEQYGKAISDFSKAIKLDLSNPDNYYQRGVAYLLKQKNDKAIADFDLAITLKPVFVKALNDRGWAYVRKRQYDQGISDFTRAIDIDPKYNNAFNNRAVAYFYKGEYDKAWVDVHRAQILGAQVHPKFLEDLRKASGREE